MEKTSEYTIGWMLVCLFIMALLLGMGSLCHLKEAYLLGFIAIGVLFCVIVLYLVLTNLRPVIEVEARHIHKKNTDITVLQVDVQKLESEIDQLRKTSEPPLPKDIELYERVMQAIVNAKIDNVDLLKEVINTTQQLKA